jgi:hypothetical protein
MRSLRRKSQAAFDWNVLVLLVGILASTVAKGDRVDEQWLVDPPQLFAVPVARPIPAFDVQLSSYSTFATAAHQVRATAILGLTGLAQVEVTNARIISELTSANRMVENVPAAGFKLYLPFGKVGRMIPDLAVVTWRTFPGAERRSLAYRLQTGELYVVGSWNLFGSPKKPSGWRGVDLHTGMNLTGARIYPATGGVAMTDNHDELKNQTGGTDEMDSEPMASPVISASPPLVSNEWMPFAGVEVWLTRQAELLAEMQWIPVLNDSPLGIDTLWSARTGVRFFFSPYLTVDVGGQYQENFETVADTNLEARVSLTVPMHRFYDRKP